MSGDQLREEHGRLTDNLSQVQGKIVKQWLTEDVQSYLAQQQSQHDKMMADSRAEMEMLKRSLDDLKGQAKSNEKAIQERMNVLRDMRTELENVEQDTDTILREKEVTEGLVSQTQTSVEKERELLTAQEKATQSRLVELEKSADWFKDRLALRFKKISGDRLQFVFTCIDPNPQKQDRPFVFCVRISSENKYIVSDCDPKVVELDDLVTKLNATNNLRSFIIEMRKRFRSLAASQSSADG